MFELVIYFVGRENPLNLTGLTDEEVESFKESFYSKEFHAFKYKDGERHIHCGNVAFYEVYTEVETDEDDDITNFLIL